MRIPIRIVTIMIVLFTSQDTPYSGKGLIGFRGIASLEEPLYAETSPQEKGTLLLDESRSIVFGPTQRKATAEWKALAESFLQSHSQMKSRHQPEVAALTDHASTSGQGLSPETEYHLRRQLAKVSNYLKIQDVFDSCLIDDSEDRNLRNIILGSAAQSELDSSACQRAMDQLLGTVASSIEASTALQIGDFLEMTVAQAESNTFLASVDFNLRHRRNFSSDVVLKGFCSPKTMINGRNARGSKVTCRNPEQKKEILRAYKDVIGKETKFTPAPKLAVEFTRFLKSTNYLSTPGSQLQLVEEKMLLITPHLRNLIEKRQDVGVKDIEKAREQMEEGIRREQIALSRFHQNTSPTQTRKDLKILVKTNPVAVGQALISQPEFAPLLCELLHEIGADDFDHQKDHERFVYGSMAVGGVLLATGVLAWLAPVVSATVAGSAALYATATTVGVTSLSAGVAASVGSGLVHLSDAVGHQNEAYQIESAIFSNNANQYSHSALLKAVDEYHSLRLRAVTELGLSAATLVPIRLMAQGGWLKDATKLLGMLISEKSGSTLRSALQLVSEERRTRFIGYLTRLPTEKLQQLLAKMRGMSTIQTKELILDLSKKSAEGVRNYADEVVKTRGARIVIKPRNTNVSRATRLLEALDNPLAAARNSTRQLTIPATIAVTTGLLTSGAIAVGAAKSYVAPPLAVLTELDENPANSGTEFLAAQIENGNLDLSGASDLAKSHNNSIRTWINSNKPMPRGEQWVRVNLIDQDGLTVLDAAARKIYAQATALARKDKVYQENLISGLLYKFVDKDPRFRSYSKEEKLLFTSYLLPVLEKDKISDSLRYIAMLNSAHKPKSLFNVDPATYNQIHWSVENDGLDYSEVSTMLERASADPKTLKSKQVAYSKELPPTKRYLAQRPDIPKFTEPRTFTDANNQTLQIRSELDIYRLIMKNPHLKEIKDPWLRGELSDRNAAEGTLHYLEDMDNLISIAPEGKFKDKDYLKLIDESGRWNNALFEPLTDLLNRIGTAPPPGGQDLSLEERENCMRDFIQQRATIILTEARLAQSYGYGSHYDNERKMSQDAGIQEGIKLISKCHIAN
jgi:hypothetical protein